MPAEVLQGDCVEVMREWEDGVIDAIVCDPPYGLEFMGKEFDRLGDGERMQGWHRAWAEEALRVLKPGGYLLAFGGSRTYHRLACAIEDAGFEIRDCVMWLYGSGFPKSLDVSKAIDRAAGAEREVMDTRPAGSGPLKRGHVNRGGGGGMSIGTERSPEIKVTAPATEDAQRWAGWGTALKPAHEPIVVARKPLIGTVAANVLRHGTGALNIDGCRISAGPGETIYNHGASAKASQSKGIYGDSTPEGVDRPVIQRPGQTLGRWPANVIHDGSEEVLAGFPVTTSRRSDTPQPVKTSKGVKGGAFGNDAARKPEGHDTHPAYVRGGFDDTGSAARFYYCAKASKAEREAGLVALAGKRANVHPTVKPVALMKYLLRLVLPPGGIALDPFAGSGTTLVAAAELGMTAIGIERDPAYVEIAAARVQAAEARAARGDADTDADTDEEGEE